MNRLRGQSTKARGEPNSRAWIVASIAIAILSMINVCTAQTTKPATLPAFENQLIRRSTPAAEIGSTTRTAMQGDSTTSAPTKLVDVRRLILSLAIVLGLIFLLREVGKKFFPSVTGTRTNNAVRVLTRAPIAHKRHLLLVQVGRRVLVVADNETQMNALSEITDPDEVAQLIGQISGPNASSEPSQDQAFDAAFGKAKTSFETDQNGEESAETPADKPSEMPDPALAEVQPSTEPAGEVASAHGEINGLMEKVRRLTQQLSRS